MRQFQAFHSVLFCAKNRNVVDFKKKNKKKKQKKKNQKKKNNFSASQRIRCVMAKIVILGLELVKAKVKKCSFLLSPKKRLKFVSQMMRGSVKIKIHQAEFWGSC